MKGKKSDLVCLDGKKEKKECRNPGLNQGPLDLQSNALPTELFRLMFRTAGRQFIEYCRTGNFSDVKTLANLAIDSFSLKFQVANPLRH